MSIGDNKLRLFVGLYTAGVDLNAVRAKLRAERLARKWSLDDLAERAGVNRSAIHDIETNRSGKPRLETIAKLIEGMGLTFSAFFLQIEALQSSSVAGTNPSLTHQGGDDHDGARSISTAAAADAHVHQHFVASLAEQLALAVDRLVETRLPDRHRARTKPARRGGATGSR